MADSPSWECRARSSWNTVEGSIGCPASRRLDSSLRDVKQDDSNNEVAPSRGGEQIDDVLDGLVGAVVAGFESDEGPDGGGSGCWQVFRTAVCGRTEIAMRLEHPLG